jgi:hypothetical protein
MSNKKSILNWLTQLDENGNELAICWEGGGDSGWAYFEVDGDREENEYAEALVDFMYDTLNYGSWAGEFTASGKAIYDHKTKTFEGTDYYGEDDNDILDVNMIIRIPKRLWFDTLHVEVEACYDEAPAVSVQLLVKNGFLTQEHTNICHNLEEVLKDDFEAYFSNYESTDDHEFRGCNDSWILERSGAIEDEDDLVFTISKVDVQTIDREDRNIVLELDEETVDRIDNRLNTVEHGN